MAPTLTTTYAGPAPGANPDGDGVTFGAVLGVVAGAAVLVGTVGVLSNCGVGRLSMK